MPYKVKRRGNELEIYDHPEGNCTTLEDVERLIHRQAEEFEIDGVYLVSDDGSRTVVDWRTGFVGSFTDPSITETKAETTAKLTSCSDCGQSISFKADTCPHCGAKCKVQGSGCGSVLVIFMVLTVLGVIIGDGKPRQEKNSFDDLDALHLCQAGIKAFANDPEKAHIPWIRPTANNDRRISFHWNRYSSMLRLRNGLGLEVAVAGTCIVDVKTKKIVELILNGKKYL